jgi:glutamate formiminotransferase / formiminotetrahydrofolate cyclodeaminase
MWLKKKSHLYYYMKAQIIECIPNFSEGRNTFTIDAIAQSIRKVDGVKLLHIDIGHAANRTVMTFVGEPKKVCEAAYQAIKKAAELIDMSTHTGRHPRMGATDVCPFVPIANISVEETIVYVNALAEKVGSDLQIPIYLYEHSQKNTARNNLSIIRSGEYEGWKEKIKLAEWQPDFGPSVLNIKAGATVMGVREFLVAYNINLNTKDANIASTIAKEVRASGKIITIKNADGTSEKKRVLGKLKHLKAIGWYIEEYQRAQVSMNITNPYETKMHTVFETVKAEAEKLNVKATGSELIGMVPLRFLKEAGVFYLQKENKNVANFNEKEILECAVKAMGLDELKPFVLEERVVEYAMKA